MKNVVLIGPPGAGKTSSGKILADKLSISFYDTDSLIEKEAGKTVREIFGDHGEEHFRQLECRLLDALITKPEEPLGSTGSFVLATGGGTPIATGNLAKLNKIGSVVLLDAGIDTLVTRVGKTGPNRPLLSDGSGKDPETATRKRLTELLAARNVIYQQADYKIDTTDLSPADTADRVIDVLKLDA